MAFLDFPSNPNLGDIYLGGNGVVYQYDGTKWTGKSYLGSQGFQGFQGIAGVQGSQGVQGDIGIRGFQGIVGAQGFQGVLGAQGSQGFQGDIGAQGSQGFQGDIGAQGSQGFQGDVGVQGYQGVLGAQGPQGFQGDIGAQGSQGFQGVPGVQGITSMIAGTGTQISTSTGDITIWSIADLQTVTAYGSTTSFPISITNLTTATSTETGALVVAGGAGIGGNLNVGEILTINQVHESLVNISSASGITVHDANSGKIFNHTSIINTFTVNLTNLKLKDGYSTVVVLVLNQGPIAYVPSNLRIDNVPQTIYWQGGITPLGVPDKKDILSFTILNSLGTYTTFGQLVTFG